MNFRPRTFPTRCDPMIHFTVRLSDAPYSIFVQRRRINLSEIYTMAWILYHLGLCRPPNFRDISQLRHFVWSCQSAMSLTHLPEEIWIEIHFPLPGCAWPCGLLIRLTNCRVAITEQRDVAHLKQYQSLMRALLYSHNQTHKHATGTIRRNRNSTIFSGGYVT